MSNTGSGSNVTEIDGKYVIAALEYARRGWKVFPCHSPGIMGKEIACSCASGASCKQIGKHPRTAHGVKDATTDEATIRAWWQQWPKANVAIATGGTGIAVLDVDPRHGGNESLAQLETEIGRPPKTVTVKTGGDGLHLYYAAPPEGIRNSAGKLGRGLDVRGDGGYVIAPPSIHATGTGYRLATGVRLTDTELAPFPKAILARLVAREAGGRAPITPGLNAKIPEGGRNATLASLAGSMRKRDMSAAGIEAALLAENAARCEPPLPDAEVRAIAHSIARYPGSEAVEDDGSVVIGDELPHEVQQLLVEYKRVQTLFAGQGKTEIDWDGRRLDQTPQGYDFSAALAFVRKGITDPSMLATILACRPDGHARARGRAYILSTVKAVLAKAGTGAAATSSMLAPSVAGTPPPVPGAAASLLGIQKVRVYDCDPPRYELDVNGMSVSFSSAQLLNMTQFKARYFERLRTVPPLPRGKDAQSKWEGIAVALAQSAQVVHLPADSSPDGALRDAVRRAVKELQIGDAIADLDDGKAYALNGGLLFKTDAIVRMVKLVIDKPKREDVARHLTNMGLECKSRRWGSGKNETVKAWRAKLPAAYVSPAPTTAGATEAWPSAPAADQAHREQAANEETEAQPAESDCPDFGVEVTA